jgi:gliding motility-associated-like protein
MLQRFISILVFTLFYQTIFAQIPMQVISESSSFMAGSSRAACDNDAGSSTQTLAASAQSNDKVYLCKNDILNIKHNGSFNLSGDPIPSTPAGIGYAWYTCKPTVSGIALTSIAADPCAFKGNAAFPAGANGILLTTNNSLLGNAQFINDGFLQNTFNAGKPIKFTFAPITFDKLSTKGEAVYEGTPSGSCVNVNKAASFDVVYLNAIKRTIVSQGDLAGSFNVFGGLSEYDNGATNYTITINLKSNPAIKGTVTSANAKHNSTVTFTTPQNGIYTIDIQDGKSCGLTFDMTLSKVFALDVKTDTVTCFGNSDGKFTVIPIGGTGPYTFVWKKSNGTNSAPQALSLAGATISGLTFGTYTVVATDNLGVSVSKDFDIVQASAIFSVTTSSTNPKCIGNKDGSVTANVAGGFLPYYYEWSTGEKGFGKNTIINVGIDPKTGANDFSVTVTDKAGCMKVASTNLTVNTVQLQKNIKDATCSGLGDGEVEVIASGGNSLTGNYNFQWSYNNFSQVSKSSKLTNLKDGTYYVTVVDDNGCQLVDSLKVKPGKTLSITPVVTNNKCFGDKAGKIVVTGNTSGGTAATPYIFTFTPGNAGIYNTGGASVISYEQLPAGKYSVVMSDQDGCSISQAGLEVKDPVKLTITNVTVKDPTCQGNAKDGEIEIKAAGGTLAAGANYKYKWNNNNLTPKITGVVAGTYTITVTDDNSCVVNKTFTLIPPLSPKITAFVVKNVNCPNSTNGSIEVTATPSSAGDVLTYTWSNNQTGTGIFDLAPNKYSVVVSDQKGCTVKGDTAVTAPTAMILIDTIVTKPTCTNSKDGTINFSIAGGTKPYTFTWSVDGKIESTSVDTVLTNLPGASYIVSVTDSKGCEMLPILVNVEKPLITKIAFTGLKEISCVNTGDCNGVATCTVIQGENPNAVYNFVWGINKTDVGTSSTQTTLCAGYNSITVSEGGKCPIVDSVFIGNPGKVALDTADISPVRCFNGNDGAITLKGKGGVPPYTYQWTGIGGPNTPTYSNLKGGQDYPFSIKDANNCEFTGKIKLAEPEKLIVDVTVVDISCAGAADGQIIVKTSGGTPGQDPANPYTYAWTGNVSTTGIAKKLSGTSYTVTITDGSGCVVTENRAPVEPSKVYFTLDTIAQPICAGYLTDVTIKSAGGGSGSQLSNYTFSIDDGGTAPALDGVIPVYAGQHVIRVFDPNGCSSDEITIKVDDPPAIRVNLGLDREVLLGKDEELNATIEATNPITKYTWSPTKGLTFSDSCKNICALLVKPTEDATYILTVMDTIGCVGADTINIIIDKNRNVYLPNIFSPNVDGTNDFMEVFASTESVEAINFFRIYDRWGNMVFESPSFKPVDSKVVGNRWNGFYKDIKANEGVYVYVCEVKFVDGVVLRFRGDVTLVR